MKQYIPVFVKDFFKTTFKCFLFSKKSFICPVCNNKVGGFQKIDDDFLNELDENRFVHSIFQFETLNFLYYSCPKCGSADRYRLYALYFQKIFSNQTEHKTLLDFAPNKSFQKFLNKYSFLSYRSADLHMNCVDDNVDITDLNIYKDNYFNYIICSHILEHVENDNLAISELFRVLKEKGKALIMVPILSNLESDFENKNFVSATDRCKYFGQKDHLRIYSKIGFVSKLSNAGFKVTQLGVDYFGESSFYLHGINKHSVLYVAEK